MENFLHWGIRFDISNTWSQKHDPQFLHKKKQMYCPQAILYMLILETLTICLHSLNQPAETKGQPNYTKGQKFKRC